MMLRRLGYGVGVGGPPGGSSFNAVQDERNGGGGVQDERIWGWGFRMGGIVAFAGYFYPPVLQQVQDERMEIPGKGNGHYPDWNGGISNRHPLQIGMAVLFGQFRQDYSPGPKSWGRARISAWP